MNILCYGDSNTWGYIPNINGYSKSAVMQQYPKEDCWWYDLDQNHNLYINGLCGRSIAHENKWLTGRNASITIYQDIGAYDNLDLVIIQLGTNDCKSEYCDSAIQIVHNLKSLLQTIKTLTPAQLLIISPAVIKEDNKITQKYYIGAHNKSEKLDALYQELAKKEDCFFISGKNLEVGEDGEHLTKFGHIQLRNKINRMLSIISNNATSMLEK